MSYGEPVLGTINFIHSISCDDAISVPAGDGSGKIPVHSSIVLFTTGTISGPEKPTQEFTFTEVSVPILTAPARGLFFGVTGGQLQVEGAVHKSPAAGVPGSIDMKFSGEVCQDQPYLRSSANSSSAEIPSSRSASSSASSSSL